MQYYRASIASDASTYKASPELQHALDKLKDEFLAAEQVVDSFNAGNQSTTPALEGLRLPLVIESADDFSALASELSRLDQDRQRLKESVVSRFESLVKSIEEKLHAYAAALPPSSSPANVSAQDVASVATPEPPAEGPEDSLFSSKLNSSDSRERKLSLSERKDFLKTLGAKAENAENRVILVEAADQLERLAKLLPEKPNAFAAARVDPSAPNQPRGEDSAGVPASERVARQLEQLRSSVRQRLFQSWRLDEVFDQAAALVSPERDKERSAALAQQEIWLSAVPRIVIGLLTAGLAGLLILVFADLVSTQLDTATNSEIVADAINSLRGSVAQVPGGEPISEPISEANIRTEYAMPVTDEEVPIAGGS